MTDFTADLDWLPAGQRDEVARHLEQTYHLNYGSQERQDSMFFRVPVAEVRNRAPAAAFLHELAETVRGGGPVRVTVPRDKAEQYRVAELLAQSARRAADQVTGQYGGPASAALATMTRTWDSGRRLSGDELERAEWVALPGTAAAAAEARSGVIG